MRRAAMVLCLFVAGLTVASGQGGAAREPMAGTWVGTWDGAGTGGFELTIEKGKDAAWGGRVSVTGEPSYQATLKTLSIDGQKLTGSYDFPPEPSAEVLLAATIDGNSVKGTWTAREKAGGTTVAEGTWTVTKK